MKNQIYLLLLAIMLITSCRIDPSKTKQNDADALEQLSAEALPTPITEIPYTVSVRNPSASDAYPTLQSHAMAHKDGKWLMVGGRTNGFHRTSTPESTFPTKTANANVWVMDHSTKEAKSAPLPKSVLAHLRSTNMLFYQDGDWLYCVGGYGSNCEKDLPECYQTWPKIAALHVPAIIEKIWSAPTGSKVDLTEDILSLDDENMRITGGALKKMGDYFYAVFGHNYNSIYKGGVTGIYTEQVRRFKIINDGKVLQIAAYQAYSDPSGAKGVASQYHRRDLGVVAAIRPDGSEGITVYGGVFTKDDGGWVNPIYIDEMENGEAKVVIDSTLEQKLNQYECAHVLMYDPETKSMFTTLLGGIGFYYYNSLGELVASDGNNWLPFVKSIDRIVRRSDGSSLESPQAPPAEMPGLLGSNAIFIPAAGITTYAGTSDILDFSKLPEGETMIGYMYGGIEATEPQASSINPTFASGKVYEVYLTKTGNGMNPAQSN